MEHHRFQGEDVVDVDIPTAAEGAIFTNSPLKVVWCFLQPAFYSLRPMIVNPKEPSFWEVSERAFWKTSIRAEPLLTYHYFYST